MTRLVFLFIVFFVMHTSAIARADVIADMSSRDISINSKFSGTELLLFGARQSAGNVIYVIRGPEQSFQVSKKERVAGIWVNSRPQRFHDIPGYYLVGADNALTLAEYQHLAEDLHIISPGFLEKNGSYALFPDKATDYHAPLLDYLEKRELYSADTGIVSFYGDTLFKAKIPFSKSIPRGSYTAEVFLFNDHALQSALHLPIVVQKTGFDAFLYDIAYRHPLLYGMICVACALFAGYAAGRIFR